MRKFVAAISLIALFTVLVSVSASAQPSWKTQSKVTAAVGATGTINTSSSAAMSRVFGWTKGNVIGISMRSKSPFRFQMWKGGSGTAAYVPVDTTAATRGTIGNYGIEYPCEQTYWVEMDSIKIKPTTGDTIWYQLYLD